MSNTMKTTIAAACLAFMAGCVPQQATKDLPPDQSYANQSTRISVTRVGVIYDNIAYRGSRGVYVIRDNETGVEYIGVSGVGVCESGSHKVGKNTHQDER